MLSHDGVCDYDRLTNDEGSGFDHDVKSTDGGARTAANVALVNKRPSSRGRSESDGDNAVPLRPETSVSGESSTASERRGGPGEENSAEEGVSFHFDEKGIGVAETEGTGGQLSRADPGGSIKKTPPRLHCLRGR